MEKTMVSIVTGVFIGLLLFAAAVGITEHQKAEQQANSLCWVKGGTYADGTCHMPEDLRTPEAKVCEAMGGNFLLRENEDTGLTATTCYDEAGKIIGLPDLEDKIVETLEDGTVLLWDTED